MISAPGRLLAASGGFVWVITKGGGVLLASRGWRPGMLLSDRQCTTFTTKKYPAPNVSSAEAGKPCSWAVKSLRPRMNCGNCLKVSWVSYRAPKWQAIFKVSGVTKNSLSSQMSWASQLQTAWTCFLPLGEQMAGWESGKSSHSQQLHVNQYRKEKWMGWLLHSINCIVPYKKTHINLCAFFSPQTRKHL